MFTRYRAPIWRCRVTGGPPRSACLGLGQRGRQVRTTLIKKWSKKAAVTGIISFCVILGRSSVLWVMWNSTFVVRIAWDEVAKVSWRLLYEIGKLVLLETVHESPGGLVKIRFWISWSEADPETTFLTGSLVMAMLLVYGPVRSQGYAKALS